MSEAKHTPGPWKVNREKFSDTASVYGADGYRVAELGVVLCPKDGGSIHDDDTVDRDCEEFEANARLIAAAPELLDAALAAEKELTGLACYLETCAHDVIFDNLHSIVASLKAKSKQINDALPKGQ